MKPILLTVLLGISVCCNAQMPNNTEFTIHSNGLIYSPDDMKVLGRLVDSLNIRFKSCALDRTYTSYAQAPLYMVVFNSKTDNLKTLRDELKAEKDFDYIINKYAGFIKTKELDKLIVKVERRGEQPYFLVGSPSLGYETNGYVEHAFIGKSKWAFSYFPKDDGNTNVLNCYYLPAQFSMQKIPDQYAKLIQYVDCMVDTSASIMLFRREETRRYEKNGFIDSLNRYVNEKMGLKRKKPYHEYDYFTPAKSLYANQNLRNDPAFEKLVLQAVDDCIQKNRGSEFLEDLAEPFIPKSKLLDMKRRRQVMGMCSMDERPRIHAQQIAMLSAETHNWDIFLRAHLDIMNDYFDRVSDGSWAFAKRQTYLKELEELGLEVTDLMIGLTLRSPAVASNHYHGNIWRLGRALSESKYKNDFENRVQQMLKDKELDEFNRGLLFVLYSSYLNHLPAEREREERMSKLKSDISSYPEVLHTGINSLKAKQGKN